MSRNGACGSVREDACVYGVVVCVVCESVWVYECAHTFCSLPCGAAGSDEARALSTLNTTAYDVP